MELIADIHWLCFSSFVISFAAVKAFENSTDSLCSSDAKVLKYMSVLGFAYKIPLLLSCNSQHCWHGYSNPTAPSKSNFWFWTSSLKKVYCGVFAFWKQRSLFSENRSQSGSLEVIRSENSWLPSIGLELLYQIAWCCFSQMWNSQVAESHVPGQQLWEIYHEVGKYTCYQQGCMSASRLHPAPNNAKQTTHHKSESAVKSRFWALMVSKAAECWV